MRIVITTLMAVSLLASSTLFASPNDYKQLQKAWAVAKYQTPEEQREKAFEKLAEQAANMTEQQPNSAELVIWHGIILSTYAGEKGGLGALGLVKEAKKLLEQAENLNGSALHGSAYTSLGSLYYQVPGWPIGFGDDDKAREYLQKGLDLNPNGIDSNYFYGDYLMDDGEYQQAINAFEKALKAPARVGREIADEGRRKEIEQAISKAREEL